MEDIECMDDMDDFQIQDEAKRLLKEIELVMKNVENSEFYAGMCSDIEQNETFQKYLFRLLGSYSHVQVVIYAMESIEYSFNSQFQFALILLLKRDFSNWIGNIQIFDPDMSPADIIVFKELDFEVPTIDENCKRQVQIPTMFYMPNPYYHLIGNLLGANWSSSCINQIFLLTNTLSSTLTDMPQCNCVLLETRLCLERILDFTTEIDIKTSDDQMFTDLFLEFAWHFFDVDPRIDMETLLPATEITERKGNDNQGYSGLDVQRNLEEDSLEDMPNDMISEGMTSKGYAQLFGQLRGPRRLRCNSFPPPPGWIKLNIYGIGTNGDQPGRYSGIFEDETGTFLGRYKGVIDVEDDVIAGLEALRHGLVRCMEGKPNAQKLLVESDNVILVQYVNRRPEPNKITMDRLNEIFDLLERLLCRVAPIYEEANETDRDWALRDECPNSE